MTINQQNKLKGYLSIAKKGGFVIIGQDKLKNYSKKLYLVLYTNATKNLLTVIESIKSTTQFQKICLSEDDFNSSVNMNGCKLIGLKNKAISDKILEIIRGDDID